MGRFRADRSLPAVVVTVVVAVVLLAICVTTVGWRVAGGRWFVVRTPSMGQTAPVGTLLLTLPVTIGAVQVGDTVTFHAPGSGQVYSHRVIAKSSTGLRTRGDINTSADSWVLSNQDLIGKVEHRWWGLGWVLRGLPLLLLCLGGVWLLTALMGRDWRPALRLAGTAVSVAIVFAVLHPWVGAEKINVTGTSTDATVRAVSTGLLPIRLSEGSASTGRLVNGQVGSLRVGTPDVNGGYSITPHLDLSIGWWIVLIAVCLAPLALALVTALRPSSTTAPLDGASSEPDDSTDTTAIPADLWQREEQS